MADPLACFLRLEPRELRFHLRRGRGGFEKIARSLVGSEQAINPLAQNAVVAACSREERAALLRLRNFRRGEEERFGWRRGVVHWDENQAFTTACEDWTGNESPKFQASAWRFRRQL